MKGDKKKKYEHTQECGSITEYVSKVVVVKKGLKRIKGTIRVKIKASDLRLSKFLWERTFLKKAIMTKPYNSSPKSMHKYIADSLVTLDCTKDDTVWYSDSEKNTRTTINGSDLWLLIKCLRSIILNDFAKIKKLSK